MLLISNWDLYANLYTYISNILSKGLHYLIHMSVMEIPGNGILPGMHKFQFSYISTQHIWCTVVRKRSMLPSVLHMLQIVSCYFYI